MIVCPASASSSEAGRAVVVGSEALLIRRLASATAAWQSRFRLPKRRRPQPQRLAGRWHQNQLRTRLSQACSCLADHPSAYWHASSRAGTGQTCAALDASDQERRERSPVRSVLAEIRLADVLIDEQRLAGVLQHDLADFQYIAVIGERERRGSILLDEQDRHTF